MLEIIIPAFTLWALLLIISTVNFYRRRRSLFIMARSPIPLIISQVYSFASCLLTALTFVHFTTQQSCEIMGVFFSLLLPLALGPMMLMLPDLMLRSILNREKANHAKNIVIDIWKYRYFCFAYVKLLIILCLSIVHLGIYFLLQYTLPLDLLRVGEDPELSSGSCFRLPLFIFDATMVIYFVVYGVVLRKIRDVDDPYRILTQLIGSWIITAPLTVITVLYPFIPYVFPPTFDFRYIYLISNALMFIMMFFIPSLPFVQKRWINVNLLKAHSTELAHDSFLEKNYAELLEIATNNWCPEIVLAYNAIVEYKRNPLKTSAVSIIEKYVKVGSPLEVNIEDRTRNELLTQFEELQNWTSREVITLFDNLESELDILISQNLVKHMKRTNSRISVEMALQSPTNDSLV